jgi:hypothetical protein
MTNAHAPADGPQPAARPLAALLRELADAASDGRVTVQADTVRAWADAIKERDIAILVAREMMLVMAEEYERANIGSGMTKHLREHADKLRAVL